MSRIRAALPLLFFLSIVVTVHAGMQAYIASWALRHFPRLTAYATFLRVFIPANAASFLLFSFALRRFPGRWSHAFAYGSFLWLGFVFISLSCVALGDLVEWWVPSARGPLLWAVPAASLLAAAWASYNAARPPLVREVTIPVEGIPPELDGFTIAQLSDVHLGVTVSMRRFERMAAQVTALQPDLIALTGDIFDAGLDDEAEVERVGRGLKAKQGIVAVLGNHEFYHGVEPSTRAFLALGARLLRNETVTLPSGMQIAGIDDVRTAGFGAGEVRTLLEGLDRKRPSLFLCHQPLYFDVASHAGVTLMLSGHTHAGQIFPFGLIVKLAYPYINGLYRDGASSLFVSPGTGQWGPPMRLFTRAEIGLLRLRAA